MILRVWSFLVLRLSVCFTVYLHIPPDAQVLAYHFSIVTILVQMMHWEIYNRMTDDTSRCIQWHHSLHQLNGCLWLAIISEHSWMIPESDKTTSLFGEKELPRIHFNENYISYIGNYQELLRKTFSSSNKTF